MPTMPPRHPLAYTALSAASFAAMAIFTRLVTRELPGDQVAFLGLTTDFSRSAAQEMAEKTGVTYDLGYDADETIVREFVTVGLPITVFLDAAGNVVKVHSGPLKRDKLRGLIRDELGVQL